MSAEPDFKIGDRVRKNSGEYGGPGIVRGLCLTALGEYRYLVAHRIEGGWGELLHIYNRRQLTKDGE